MPNLISERVSPLVTGDIMAEDSVTSKNLADGAAVLIYRWPDKKFTFPLNLFDTIWFEQTLPSNLEVGDYVECFLPISIYKDIGVDKYNIKFQVYNIFEGIVFTQEYSVPVFHYAKYGSHLLNAYVGLRVKTASIHTLTVWVSCVNAETNSLIMPFYNHPVFKVYKKSYHIMPSL